MKVVFHEDFYQVYASDPAAAQGRLEAVVKVIEPVTDFVKAEPSSEADIAAVHTDLHLRRVKQMGVYDIAALAAGGAIQAAILGLKEPCFGLIRPPGHHASSDGAWGFCYFNNMAIAIEYLKRNQKIQSAYVLDIDLHFGDGTASIFQGVPEVVYFHPQGRDSQEFIDTISLFLAHAEADVVAVSAGFDRHEHDWGGMLKTEDYQTIGELVKGFAQRVCRGRRYGVLEGGYNHDVLGMNVRALLEGMS